MTHPLTDKMCYQMSINNMEAYGDLRDAADWQLEQVIEWIEENGYEYVYYHHELGCQTEHSRMIADLRKAMRPPKTVEILFQKTQEDYQ